MKDRALYRRVIRRLARLWLVTCNRRFRGDAEGASHYLARFNQLSATWKLGDDTGCKRLLTRRWVA